jgi:hypothetical protein
MRQFILILAMVLVSATAQAGVSRGLTLASNDEPAAAEPSSNAAEAPKFVARPSAVDTKAEQPKPAAEKNADAPKVDKPKRKHESTEARVIYELHRHGIYW